MPGSFLLPLRVCRAVLPDSGFTKKAVVVSAIYLNARHKRRSNRNEPGFFPRTATQQERVLGFRNTLQALSRTPYILGADWFQYYDEPAHGREDGENYNFGLVDIHDQPYEQITAAAAALNLYLLKSHRPAARSDASQG